MAIPEPTYLLKLLKAKAEEFISLESAMKTYQCASTVIEIPRGLTVYAHQNIQF